MAFIERDKALSRISRNYEAAKDLYQEAMDDGNVPLRQVAIARCNAIAQTWAEVTDQYFYDAETELLKACRD